MRTAGWIDPAGWRPNDMLYMQSETQAALLGWLWSLTCPVVNRYPAGLWYRPRPPLLSWHSLLRSCGVPTPEALVTNVEIEARAFGQGLARAGLDGAVYGPLTSDTRYLIVDEADWSGLAAMQACAPVSLACPHGLPQLACIVGERVVWEGVPAPESAALEPALRRFAAAAGLSFLELALAPAPTGVCVIAIETQPDFGHFGKLARQRIVEGLADLLTRDADAPHDGACAKLLSEAR